MRVNLIVLLERMHGTVILTSELEYINIKMEVYIPKKMYFLFRHFFEYQLF